MGFKNSNWTYAGTNTTGTISDIQFSTIDAGFIFGYSDSRNPCFIISEPIKPNPSRDGTTECMGPGNNA